MARATTDDVLRQEFGAIHPGVEWKDWDDLDRKTRSDIEADLPDDESRERFRAAAIYRENVHALGSGGSAGQAALCLSGGGIRSAAFALGVLQGLARKGLLSRIHYLSTVSGGGYAGCWLSAWAHRAESRGTAHVAATAAPIGSTADAGAPDAPEPRRGTFPQVEEALARRPRHRPEEAEPIRRLRSGQKFLTPRAGIASADTWAACVTIVRDLLLNWLVFLPLLAAVLLLPRVLDSSLTLWTFWTSSPSGEQPASSLVWLLAPGWDTSSWRHHYANWPPLPAWLDSLAAAFALYGLITSMANRPSRGNPDFDQANFVRRILCPVTIAAFLLLMATCHWRSNATTPTFGECVRWMLLTAALFIVVRAGAAVAKLGLRRCARLVIGREIGDPEEAAGTPRRRDLLYELAALAFSGGFLGFLGWSGGYLRATASHGDTAELNDLCGLSDLDHSSKFGALCDFGDPSALSELARFSDLRDVATYGVPWFLMSFLVSQVLYTALTSRASFGERDREWMARASGYYGAVAVVWVVFCWLVLHGYEKLDQNWAAIVGAAGLSGGLTLAGAASSLTKATSAAVAMKERLPLSKIVTGLSVVFVLCSSVLLAEGTAKALARLPLGLGTDLKERVHIKDAAQVAFGATGHAYLDETGRALNLHSKAVEARAKVVGREKWQLAIASAAAVVLVGFSLLASVFINVNHFSLHAFYRNRLVRTFLGASNTSSVKGSTPGRNTFDGFSDTDNLRMGELWRDPATGRVQREGPFPVVNMALNLLATRNLAWQERKAAPFVSTPLHTGGHEVGYRDSRFYASNLGHAAAEEASGRLGEAREGSSAAAAKARRVPGLTLGTAMAVSGAAMSPNWGYHSSPLTSFLMMLFNLRLGWWLGNPAHPTAWLLDGPKSSWRLFLQEALGQTSDREPYVYLSDGGHFDNLGLYEMVRRRCKTIIVSDASSDPNCTLEDLGRTVRSISIDLGVSVEFAAIDVRKRGADPATSGVYCAIGSIRYPERPGDGEMGTVIYIKPGLYLDAPADVRAFAAANAKFPHDSTSNQWFTESQFESYRALGSHAIRTMCGGRPENEPMALEEFVASAGEYVAAYRKASDGGSKLRLVQRPADIDAAGKGRGSGPDLVGSGPASAAGG